MMNAVVDAALSDTAAAVHKWARVGRSGGGGEEGCLPGCVCVG